MIAVLLLAFFAAWPLFGGRFIPTHDGEYHIIRFWQFYKELSSGHWFPRWAPDLNNGLGLPLFTFNYPLPNYIGSLFHFLGLSFVDSVKWTLSFGYLAATLLCFLWLKKLFGVRSAVVGTIVGSFVPYWFVDLYVRGSVGEVWAIAWIFASLYAISAKRAILLSIFVGLLILSHNILALIFVPFVMIYVILTNKKYIWNVCVGIGIASYFWIPALYERRFITGISPVNLFDHFPSLYQLLIPSWGTGFRGSVGGGNEMSYQIGIAPLLVLLLSIRKKTHWFFVLCSMFAVFMMLPWSVWLWRMLPFVQFVQYPWRLLSVIVVTTPVLTARIRYGWVMAVLAVLFSYGYSRPVTYEPRTDAYYLTQESFTKGTNSLGNAFQTIWMKEGKTATPSGGQIIPIAYYPGWTANVGVTPSENGLILIPKKDGVRVWLGTTWWQRVAAGISVASLFTVLLSFILKKS